MLLPIAPSPPCTGVHHFNDRGWRSSTNSRSRDGGPATSAQLYNPRNVAVDAAGNLYIADSDNSRVRRVAPDGIITTVAGGGTGLGVTGPATNVALGKPSGVAVDTAGNFYIADDTRVLRVTWDGIITTLAGNATRGYSVDGGPAISAALDEPRRLAIDSAGNLYIADRFNHRVRRVTPDGVITTIVGNGTGGYSGDGGPASSAQLSLPTGVAVDTAGNLYVADRNNARVRRVTPGGTITTVAGGGIGVPGDGGQATNVSLGP